MADDDGDGGRAETFGVWRPRNDDIVDRFDRHYASRRGSEYRRSREVIRAMRLALAVDEVLVEHGYELDERGRRSFVRQAVLDRIRRESEDGAE